MIRSLFTVRQSPIQRILTNTNVYNKSVSNSIFQISLVSQTRHLATNKKKITAEKLEKLEKNLEEQEYAENPEEIARPTKLLAKITAIHREKWHLKQKPKVSSLIPHNIKTSYYIHIAYRKRSYFEIIIEQPGIWIARSKSGVLGACFWNY